MYDRPSMSATTAVAHRAHVAHVTIDMGDPLGIARKSGRPRGIERCRTLSTFSYPTTNPVPGVAQICWGFPLFSNFVVRTAIVTSPHPSSPIAPTSGADVGESMTPAMQFVLAIPMADSATRGHDEN